MSTTTIKILREALRKRKSVKFIYKNKNPKEPETTRIGQPHAIYITSMGNINVDMYQTYGAVAVGSTLPLWKDFTVSYIEKVEMLENEPSFEIAPGYKTYNKKYVDVIAKIQAVVVKEDK